MKKSTIIKVAVYTWRMSPFEARIYYTNGRQRTIEFNYISELPKTVQNVIIGNENTVVSDNKTVFFTDNSTENDINRTIANDSEWCKSITLRGENLNEWNVLMVYLMVYTSSMFRITRDKNNNLKVLVNPFGSTIGCNYDTTSSVSILASAVTKYATNDILNNRIEEI